MENIEKKNKKYIDFDFYQDDDFFDKDHHSIEQDLCDIFKDNTFIIIFEDNFNVLKIEIEKCNNNTNMLYKLINNNIYLDSNFAYNIKILDVLKANCFLPKNDLGKLIIDFLDYKGYNFVLRAKIYTTMDHLYLSFLACADGFWPEVIEKFS